MPKTRILASVVISTIMIWLFVCNPENSSEGFFRCPLHLITGFQCPFCGSQRAIHHLLHLHPIKALAYNPWLAAMGVYAIVYAAGHWRSNTATLTMIMLTLFWGVARNIIIYI